ncbi:hypothetical protein IWQ49_006460 [Labrenzia sp. EL_126]|nr:hypothetical protein [Labrenzia sp. EL_126]
MYPQVATLINLMATFFERHAVQNVSDNELEHRSTMNGFVLLQLVLSDFFPKENIVGFDPDKIGAEAKKLLEQTKFFEPTDKELEILFSRIKRIGETVDRKSSLTLTAGAIYECSYGQISIDIISGVLDERFKDTYENYSIVRNTLRQVNNRIDHLIKIETEVLENTFDRWSIEKTEKLMSDLKEKNDEALKKKTNEVLEHAEEQIDLYGKKVGATLVVEAAHTLWGNKSRSHKTSFYVSGGIFVAIVAVALGLPTYYWEALYSEILNLDKLFENHIFGGVLVLLVPILGVAWILRLISRFTIQNMILADDAEMRKVMAETYVKLVTENAIHEPEDRAIILTALFRPLPGSHGEDVSPPSISDVIKQSGRPS